MLKDDLSQCVLYSGADAMLIPSRQDNLPNTGALPDIVVRGVEEAQP